MLPKVLRLNLKKDFVWVKSQSKRVETANLKLFLRFGDERSSSINNPKAKVGIALSGSFFKNASQRNKARRLTSLAIEALYSQLPDGANLIIMPKDGVLTSSKEELIVELENVKNPNLFN